ncbi:MAG: transglutaminase family protein [Chloroflexota bacterium]|nr:transglutaminase family protein [Chloroflexota bacterium]
MSKKKAKKKKNNKENAEQQAPRRTWQWDYRLIRRGVVGLFCLAAIILSLYWMPAELHYTITQNYVLSVDEAAVVYLKVILPSSNPYQSISDPEISWPGIWEVEPHGRLDVLRLVATVQKGESVEAEISYKVNLFQGLADWTGEPIRSDDLAETAAIPSDSTDVLALAAAMTTNDSERASVRNFYTFVRRDAETVAGGPEAQINLLVALSRAVGIPARPVRGIFLPNNLPFFSTQLDGDKSLNIWSEVQFNDAWHQVDPTRAVAFFQHNLFGWTDGRHLTYDKPTKLASVLGSHLDEAQADGDWQETSDGAFPFTAWADLAEDEGHLTRSVTLKKTWDGRWIMLFSAVVILLVLNWMIELDESKRLHKYQGSDDDD